SVASMPHLSVVEWDYHDRLHATSRQVVNAGTPETTYYVYDAHGRRVRKVTERQAAEGVEPPRMKERLYVGGWEVYREPPAAAGAAPSLARETLHVAAESKTVALVETRTIGADPSPPQLLRFQLDNHLGSSTVELASDGGIISYEEYYPYGSTS